MKNIYEQLIELPSGKFNAIWQHYVDKNAGKVLKEFPEVLERAKRKREAGPVAVKPVDQELITLINTL